MLAAFWKEALYRSFSPDEIEEKRGIPWSDSIKKASVARKAKAAERREAKKKA